MNLDFRVEEVERVSLRKVHVVMNSVKVSSLHFVSVTYLRGAGLSGYRLKLFPAEQRTKMIIVRRRFGSFGGVRVKEVVIVTELTRTQGEEVRVDIRLTVVVVILKDN